MSDNTFLIQTVIGAVVAWGLERLKLAPWFPWLTEETVRRAKVAWNVVLAIASALAVGVLWDTGTGTLTITGLTWANIQHGFVLFLASLAAQQTSYSMMFKTRTMPLAVDITKIGKP